MIARLFTDHPRSVDENYGEHFFVAGGFALAMLWGGVRVLIHALVPGLFITAGSSTIKHLNARMVEQRDKKRHATTEMHCCEWII
jgi:Family of unknown function (DUF6356)